MLPNFGHKVALRKVLLHEEADIELNAFDGADFARHLNRAVI
jgi:hypothetical protein